jgi:hypothetical protein
MARGKKTFSCGHTGKGQYCHRCVQEEERQKKEAQAKNDWNSMLSGSPVRLDHLPKEVAKKTLRVMVDLNEGKTYQDFKGKRMITMGLREIVSVPIGRKYRLICKAGNGPPEYIEVITHEEYNNRLASGGWSV